jgi:hypothetical protein
MTAPLNDPVLDLTNEGSAQTPADQAPAADSGTWRPPASQADLDRIVQDRLARERAKFSDYDELAEKARYWDEIEAASQTEYEKQAEALQAAETRWQQARERIVTAELRAALTGVVPDPSAVIEDLNVSRFVGEDGEVNTEAVNALRAKYAALLPASTTSPRMAPNPAQGTSAQPPLSLGEQIAKATADGDIKAAMRLKARMAVASSTN